MALPPPLPPPSARLALQPLQRFGSFLKPLSAKNICSPAVKTNSAPHSEHFNTLSWNSMSAPPENPLGQGEGAVFYLGPLDVAGPRTRERAWIPWGLRSKNYTSCTQTSLPNRGLIPEVRRRASSRARNQSCSRRCFLRSRFRESASLARRFSPGFM